MAPIKIGLVGLSSSGTGWAARAHLPYLLSARGRERYQIVALLNSSEASARASIARHGLPAETTRAYGDAAALAADPDVELVVVVTRVDTHYAAALPSLRAGKAALVEWPLAHNAERAGELVAAARATDNERTAVALQGRLAPVFLKIREVLRSGRIGRVLSSDVRVAGGVIDWDVITTPIKYFTDLKVGGNPYTIGVGHLIDSIQFILGEVQEKDSFARFQIQRPHIRLRDPKTGAIVETVTSDVPDLTLVVGSLPGSDVVQEGATLNLRYHSFVDDSDPGLVWTIYGEKGELRLKSPSGSGLQATAYTKPVTIEVYDFESGKTDPVEWAWPDWQEDLPIPARNIAALYEAYAEGDKSKYASFEDALHRHEQLGKWLDNFH